MVVYPIRIVSDKMSMNKILFLLGYWVWVWIRKIFVNLLSMDMDKGFLLPVIHWVYEFDYGATRSTDGPCVMDRFSVFKVQMIDPTDYNVLHMKI
jgi:hypothetical protein